MLKSITSSRKLYDVHPNVSIHKKKVNKLNTIRRNWCENANLIKKLLSWVSFCDSPIQYIRYRHYRFIFFLQFASASQYKWWEYFIIILFLETLDKDFSFFRLWFLVHSQIVKLYQRFNKFLKIRKYIAEKFHRQSRYFTNNHKL